MSQYRVAIVDDEEEILSDLCQLIEDEGVYSVVTYSDPEEALNDLMHSPPDVLITDVSMPGITGLELLASLRKVVPDLPALVVSGYLDAKNLITCIKLGATDVIEKPYKDENLLDSLAVAARVGKARKKVINLLNVMGSAESNSAIEELNTAQKLLVSRYFV